ncbi:hypothetical protein DFS33DRAFT_1272170 [Desarmillaria ectypa]|nr:hypothetical protein DFS33DRAFT_1272170 [Desarmillaria ectypa]
MHHPLGIYIEYISVVITAALWGLTCVQTLSSFVWRVIDNSVSPVTIEVAFKVIFLRSWYLAVVASTTQLFFTWRIWQFCSGSRWKPAILLFVPAAFYISREIIHTYSTGAPLTLTALQLQRLVGILLRIETRTDQSRTSCCDYLLLRVGSQYHSTQPESRVDNVLSNGRKNTLKSTTQILHRLSILIVNTGLWTSLVTLLTLLGLVIWEEQDIYAALSFITCPLYCNTLLANLNTRDIIRQGLFPSNDGAETTSFLQLDTHRNRRELVQSIPPNDQFASRKFENASDSLA